MKASIIIIGDEILLGQVTDTNSGEIARTLVPMGWEIVRTTVIGDNADRIRRAVDISLSDSDLVITTGGLGSTKDDITMRVLCDVFGCHLVHNQEVADNVERIFAARGLKVNDLTLTQAIVPDGCEVIINRYGTAPITWYERDGKVLVSMPGVPFETVGMLHDVIAEKIRRRFRPDTEYRHHTLILTGVTESDLAMHLDAYETALPDNLHLAYLPVPGYLRLRLDGYSDDAASFDNAYEKAMTSLKEQVAQWLVCDGDLTPAEILLEALRAKAYTVATAESCTGGNIAHSITSVSGCSEFYLGSVVSYANSVKQNVLGVNETDLINHGAVSQPVVRAMAEGVARLTGADCSMATSGIAGPGGGTPDKPVGTVWMAVHLPGRTVSFCQRFPGNRVRVIDRATTEVIMKLIQEIRKN